MTKKELREKLTKRYLGVAVKGGAFPVAEHCNILQATSADHKNIIYILLLLGQERTESGIRKIEKIDVSKNMMEQEYTREDMTIICSALDAIVV